MVLAAYITSAFCIAATGAWHLLRGQFKSEAQTMLRMSLGLAAILVPCNCCSAIWSVTLFTTTSPPSLPRSRHGGRTNSPHPKC